MYLQDTWLGKKLIVTGPVPTDKNISLFNNTSNEIQFTLEEVVSLAAYEVGGWFRNAKYKRLLVVQVQWKFIETNWIDSFFSLVSEIFAIFQGHIFTSSVLGYYIFEKGYMLDIAGFRNERPPFVNFLLLVWLIMFPFWLYLFGLWEKINNYRQITENLYVAMRFYLHKSLISAFVKEYKMNEEFPVHHYWFALFCGYNRPLDSLILTLVSEEPVNMTQYWWSWILFTRKICVLTFKMCRFVWSIQNWSEYFENITCVFVSSFVHKYSNFKNWN